MSKQKNGNLVSLIIVLFISSISVFILPVYAGNSSNYEDDPNNSGNSNGDTSSGNYQIENQVGDVAVGTSSSNSYSVNHGFFYPLGSILMNFKVAPEKRVQNPPNGDAIPNWDISDLRIQVRNVGTANVVFETMVDSTNTDGIRDTNIPMSVPAGAYDVTVKGISHLTFVKSNVILNSGSINTIDFTNNGSGEVQYMYAGDVNLTFGDDKVNSLDIGTILPDLNSSEYRTDLNQDSKVNSLDIGIIIANLNREGQ